MDMDRRENRNCYAYRKFEYLVRNCKNRGITNRRMEIDQDLNNNLNGKGGLESPNQISVAITDLQYLLG